jgi:hypothetical protein
MVGTVVNRKLKYNFYSDEVQKGWKETRCNGLCSVEVDLLGMIEGNGRRFWKLAYEDTSLQDDALYYSILRRSFIENPSKGRASD